MLVLMYNGFKVMDMDMDMEDDIDSEDIYSYDISVPYNIAIIAIVTPLPQHLSHACICGVCKFVYSPHKKQVL